MALAKKDIISAKANLRFIHFPPAKAGGNSAKTGGNSAKLETIQLKLEAIQNH
jgi:hypothetical protein